MATHASMTGADLHEPKGVAGASAGTVYVADGLGSGVWTASVNQDVAIDNIPYVRLNQDWAAVPVNPVDSYWRSDTTGIAAPPAGGDIIWNNATQASATHIFISADTIYGVTKRPEMLNYIQSYDTLTLYAAGDPNIFQRWKIVASADGTSYIDYTVELIASNGGNIADNTDLVVTFQANLSDTHIQDIIDGLATATFNQIWACDGAGSGSFQDPTAVINTSHGVSYIAGNSQAITITVGGDFYQVKHASITWTNQDAEGAVTWNSTDKTFDVTTTGFYVVHMSGAWKGSSTGEVIQLGVNVGATVASGNVLNTGRCKQQLDNSALRSHINYGMMVYIPATAGDKICPMVTSTTNGATVTIVDMHMYIELVHT